MPVLLTVFVEIRFYPVCCWTEFTCIRLSPRVREHVVLQCVVTGQILQAYRARIRRPDASVHLDVSVQHVTESKGPWTLIALEGSLLRVDQVQVTDHFPLLLESLQAVLALKVLLVRMSLDVCLVLGHQHKLFLAQFTGVPFVRMRLQVCPQNVAVLEDLAALKCISSRINTCTK